MLNEFKLIFLLLKKSYKITLPNGIGYVQDVIALLPLREWEGEKLHSDLLINSALPNKLVTQDSDTVLMQLCLSLLTIVKAFIKELG